MTMNIQDIQVKIKWSSGKGAEKITDSEIVDTATLPDHIKQELFEYGVRQKYVDSTSLDKDKGGATHALRVESKRELFEKCRDALVKGEWTRKKSGSNKAAFTWMVNQAATLKADEQGADTLKAWQSANADWVEVAMKIVENNSEHFANACNEHVDELAAQAKERKAKKAALKSTVKM